MALKKNGKLFTAGLLSLGLAVAGCSGGGDTDNDEQSGFDEWSSDTGYVGNSRR